MHFRLMKASLMVNITYIVQCVVCKEFMVPRRSIQAVHTEIDIMRHLIMVISKRDDQFRASPLVNIEHKVQTLLSQWNTESASPLHPLLGFVVYAQDSALLLCLSSLVSRMIHAQSFQEFFRLSEIYDSLIFEESPGLLSEFTFILQCISKVALPC